MTRPLPTTRATRTTSATSRLLVLLALAACGRGPSRDSGECNAPEVYDNGVCDEDCSHVDPDCGSDGGTSSEGGEDPCAVPSRYGDGSCDLDCAYPDPDCDGAEEDPCASPNRYGDGPCDTDCFSVDPDCVEPPLGQLFIAGVQVDPVPYLAGGGAPATVVVEVQADPTVRVTEVELQAPTMGVTSLLLDVAGPTTWTGEVVAGDLVDSGTYDLALVARGVDDGAGGASVSATVSFPLALEQQAHLGLVSGRPPEPSVVLTGTSAPVLFTAEVDARFATVQRVYADLSALGGGELTLLDDGSNGDIVAGDGVLGATWVVPDTLAGGAYPVTTVVVGEVGGQPAQGSVVEELRVRGRASFGEISFVDGGVTFAQTGFDTIPLQLVEAGAPATLTARAAVVLAGGATVDAVTIDLSGLGLSADSPLFDDGPMSAGGHEPEGQSAGDRIFHRVQDLPATTSLGAYLTPFRLTALDPGGDHDITAPARVTVYERAYDIVDEYVPFATIRGAGAPLSMNQVAMGRAVYSLPFSFPFYGAPVDTLTLFSDGLVFPGEVFWGGNSASDAVTYSRMGAAPLIAVHHNAWMSTRDIPGGGVFALERGVSPDRSITFEWYAGFAYPGQVEAQLTLYESGVFEVHYGDLADALGAYQWSLVAVDSETRFDEVIPSSTAPQPGPVVSQRRWRFTPRP